MKINLVPEVKQEQLRIQKLNATTTMAVTVAAFIVGSLIVCLSIYNIIRSTQISSTKKNIEKTNHELEAYRDLEETVISLETGLADAKKVINGGSKWSKFLTELEKVTPGDVQLTNLTIKGSDISATLSGKGVESIDRFIKSFSNYKVDNKNLFTNVSVTGYTSEKGNVKFQSKFTLAQGVLW